MNDSEERAAEIVVKTDPINLPFNEKFDRWVDFVFGGRWRVRKITRDSAESLWVMPYGSMATFDDDKLTLVVLASHLFGLRAEITTNGFHGLKILVSDRRVRSGQYWETHPGFEGLLGTLITKGKILFVEASP